MSAACIREWEQAARDAQVAGDAPAAVATMLNARGLLDTRRGEPVPWTPTTIRHALNAAGRFRGPRWAAGAWGVPAEAFHAHRQPDFAELALKLADAGEHAGTIAEALNGLGTPLRGGIWAATEVKALLASARALMADRKAAQEAVTLNQVAAER